MFNYCHFYEIGIICNLISSPRLSSAQSRDGINWMNICTKLQSALYQPCNSYVNPDNTSTNDGEVALKCIKNGIVPGGGAAALGVPTGIITRGLNILAGSIGYGNIVNPDELNKIEDLGSITNLIP